MAPCFNRILISFIYLLVVLMGTTVSILSHDEECVALYQFKQSILHQDYDTAVQKFKSWRKFTSNKSDINGSDCCLWDGVVCSNKYNGHVIELDLSESFLRGPISSNSTLFNLVYLRKLNLSMNDFAESRIPSEIARLKQLRTLDLSNSSFSGQIPHEISYLVQLSSLNLSLNPLKLKSPSLLLQNLTRLEELHLAGVEINSSVPRFLANFSSLTSINFNDCQLQDEFPSSIFHLPKLKSLFMRNNFNLSGTFPEFQNNTLLDYLDLDTTGFAGIIPEYSISKLNHLVVLNLRNCYFSGPLPISLSNLTQLIHLNLRNNEFTGLVPSLVSLSKLITLDISIINLDKGSLHDWIGKLTELRELRMNGINISGEILPSLANLTKLSIMGMSKSFISGRIPSSFMNLTQLTKIGLDQNQMHGPISSEFSNFKSLIFLNLGYNSFNGRVVLDTFVGLNKLETLYLDENKISFVATHNYTNVTLPALKNLGLSSCNLKKFPSFLDFQNKMEVLLLSRNKIYGSVPVRIWNNSLETMQIIDFEANFITGFDQNPRYVPWVNLGALSLAYNKLQGRLPIPPPTIVYYSMEFNYFTGEIPPSICEGKSLQLLDLSFNNMTGTVPPCISSLSNSLSVLNLNGNNLHGTMMNEFTPGCLLKRIDLSENQFTGELSKSLANCTSLQVLSLRDNSFNDVFPYWLGTLAELQVLILGSNKLYGAIQGSPTDKLLFSKLRVIDLINNGFSGELPQNYIESWHAMKTEYVGKPVAVNLGMRLGKFTAKYEFSMILTNKGVKTEYEKILNVFVGKSIYKQERHLVELIDPSKRRIIAFFAGCLH